MVCYARQTAKCRALRILIALKRMQNPESLLRRDGTLDPAELGLSKEAVTDPHSGKPLVVRKKGDGWLIYSVGPDQIDDGGDLGTFDDPGSDLGIAAAPPGEMP